MNEPVGSTDPDQIHSRADLAAGLRALQARGGLSLRNIETTAKNIVATAHKDSKAGFVELPRSTVGDFVKSGALSVEQLRTFLAVCRVSRADGNAWLRAWDRVSGSGSAGTVGVSVMGGIPPRADYLRYLEAIAVLARDHPNPGLASLGPDVPMDAVYVAQHVKWEDSAGRRQTAPADDLPTRRPIEVLLGAPGVGKSSLLRRRLASAAKGWPADGAALPVLTPATAMAARMAAGPRPIEGALRDVAAATLRPYDSRFVLPEAFFATPPSTTTPWLILLDGIDEITDRTTRRDLLRQLTAAVTAQPDTYRAIVAGRHLATDELMLLGPDVPKYQLQPFSSAQVDELARSWFAATGLAEPDQVRERFRRAVHRAGLDAQVRNPLMAALLCLLHRAHPDTTQFRNGRGSIYEAVTTRLLSNRHSTWESDRLPTLRSHRAVVREQADRLVEEIPTLVQYVAHRRQRGSEEPTVVLAETYSAANRPVDVPTEDWQTFLGRCLISSGLLVDRGDDLEFLHQTFQEFLAAAHVVDNPDLLAAELERLFPKRWPRHWPFRPVGAYSRWAHYGYWGNRVWPGVANKEKSYCGFLLDHPRLPPDCGLTARLLRVASARNWDSAVFLANQRRLGTHLPRDVRTAAADRLVARATPSRMAKSLASLGPTAFEHPEDIDPQAAGALDAEALIAAQMDDGRAHAAQALFHLDEFRGRATLRLLAKSPYLLTGKGRVVVAATLTEIEDPSGPPMLSHLAASTHVSPENRINAASALVSLGHAQGREHLLAWTRPTLAHHRMHRVPAAIVLAKHGDDRGLDALADALSDPTLYIDDRWNAAYALNKLGDPRGLSWLRGMAEDHTQRGGHRIGAAYVLGQIAPDQAGAVYSGLVADPALTRYQRHRARRHARAGRTGWGSSVTADPGATEIRSGRTGPDPQP